MESNQLAEIVKLIDTTQSERVVSFYKEEIRVRVKYIFGAMNTDEDSLEEMGVYLSALHKSTVLRSYIETTAMEIGNIKLRGHARILIQSNALHRFTPSNVDRFYIKV